MKDSAAAAVAEVVGAVAAAAAGSVAVEGEAGDSAAVRPAADFPVAVGLPLDRVAAEEAGASRVAAPTAGRRSVHPAVGAPAAVSPVVVVRGGCNPEHAQERGSETGRRLVRVVVEPEPANCPPAGSVEAIDPASARVQVSAPGSVPELVPGGDRASVLALLPARGRGRCRA
jgi:hypothetical protein